MKNLQIFEIIYDRVWRRCWLVTTLEARRSICFGSINRNIPRHWLRQYSILYDMLKR